MLNRFYPRSVANLFQSVDRQSVYWLIADLKTVDLQNADCRPTRKLPLVACSSTVILGDL